MLKDQQLQFLAVLDKRDREFHQIMDAKDRNFHAELARCDATITQLQKELAHFRSKVQIMQDQHSYNSAASGFRLASLEGQVRSKSFSDSLQ